MPSRRRFSRRRLWFESEPLWTRQRSSPVEKGCELFGRDLLSVAMRVCPSACPLEVLEHERGGKLLRQSRLLVDLDHLAGAHDLQVGAPFPDQRLGRVGVRIHDEDGVARPNPRPRRSRRTRHGVRPDRGPLLGRPVSRGSTCSSRPVRGRDTRRRRPNRGHGSTSGRAWRPGAPWRRSSTSSDFAKRPTIPHICLKVHIDRGSNRRISAKSHALHMELSYIGGQKRVRYSRISYGVTCSW